MFEEISTIIHPALLTDHDIPVIGYESMINGSIAYPLPKVGSDWLNLRRMKVYRVFGYALPCEDDGEIYIVYRSFDMSPNHYRYRLLTEWYGKNRNGNWRFIEAPKYE